MFSRLRILAAAVVLAATPSLASSQIVSGQWYTFGFGGVGTSGFSCPGCTLGQNPASVAAPTLWTYTSTFGGTFTLLDGFLGGDTFGLYDFGSFIGATSAVPTTGDCGSNITACLGDADISKGSFAFGAGDHSWSAMVTASPHGGGAAFFRIDEAVSVVPEPSTYAMMGVGLAALAFARRRRKA